MPTYDYKCSRCDHKFEEVQSMREPLLTKCSNCGNETLVRLIGGGGVIFKGSGFYQTDYKSSGDKKEPTPAVEKKPETKSAVDPPASSTTPKKE